MAVLVHVDEARPIWVVDTISLRGRWQRVDMEPAPLVDLVEEHAEYACDPTFHVRFRFRNVESGAIVDAETVYDAFADDDVD
jgi:hypothetical protein